MERNYLAAQFATRRPPGLSDKNQIKITCLRSWILIKALEFARSGCRYDLNLRQVCAQLRMACDDKRDPGKLGWFLSLTEPSTDFQEFELALRDGIKRKDQNAPAGAEDTVRAIRALLDDRKKPGLLANEDELKPTADLIDFEDAEDQRDVFETDFLDDSFFLLPGTSTEAGSLVKKTQASENQTLPEILRDSRGIVFQSLEDQQFLRCSWNRLRTDEEQALNTAIQSMLRAGALNDRLLASLTIVALLCRRSMETVESLKLGVVAAEDWQLDTREGVLHRLPARRSVRWRAKDTALHWVRPLCEEWRLDLVDNVRSTLREAFLLRPSARTVGELWTDSSTRLEKAFNQWCAETPGLLRVTSGLVVRVSEQHAFEQSDDPMFARLVTSPARAGIPGAGAYASWSLSQVANTVGGIASAFAVQSISKESSDNALGSELDPDDAMLSQALTDAYNKVLTLAEENSSWVEYHNHLVAYTVVVLLAATGARPVESVFESGTHFDLNRGYLYIEDKVSPKTQEGRSGRIVPLPLEVVAFLINVYRPHIQHLAEGLRSKLPELSTELDKLAVGLSSIRIPLFFFLRIRPDFDWLVVNESTLDQLRLFKWPLPWNLFRHRLAVRLRELRLDPELIDAQLGHAEAGSETYGDNSPRCWRDDVAQWQPSITSAYQRLCIEYPPLAKHDVHQVVVSTGYIVFQEEGLFGKQARAEQRRRQRARAKQQALDEIQNFVGTRPTDSLSSSQWEELGRKMILKDSNLPQANATLRYQVYEEYLHDLWRNTGSRPRIRSWLVSPPEARSAFHANAIGATDRLQQVRIELDEVFASIQLSRTGKIHCANLAALDLCLNGRVADRAVLDAVAKADANSIRLVILDKRLYVEYSDVLMEVENPPVARFLVPSRSSLFLIRALSAGKVLSAVEDIPSILMSLLQAAGLDTTARPSFEKLLAALSSLVDHENSLCLPGLVAALMAGRLTSYALGWNDWIRARTGGAHINPLATPENLQNPEDALPQPVPRQPIGVLNSKELEASKRSNRRLISDVRAALLRYLNPAAAPDQHEQTSVKSRHKKGTNTENSSRRDARAAIESLIQRCDPAVSVAVHALAAWTLSLLNRPYKKGLLDAASIKRYLDALSYGFISFGYATDLADLDADELTEFYMSVIDPVLADNAESDTAETSDATRNIVRKRDQKFVMQRLREFHRFASKKYGIDTPDWSEIGEGLTGAMALPGFILEHEYLHALKTLCVTPESESPEAVRDAFVLLLTYRFGLRGGEAIGLARDEWVDVADTVVVLVTNHHRKLKTRGSKRQVPLIGGFCEFERRVIRRWLDHWAAETSSNSLIPLFYQDRFQGGVVDIRRIRDRVIAALRASTCSAHINLHHTRHAFANRVGLSLMCPSTNGIWHASAMANDPMEKHLRLTLLNTDKNTRRAPWAAARLLGHATPRTTAGSYLHFLYDWAAALVAKGQSDAFGEIDDKGSNSVTNLGLWTRDADYLATVPTPLSVALVPCTPLLAMEYFRLRAQGMGPASAAQHCRLDLLDAQAIEEGLLIAGRRLRGVDNGMDNGVSSISLPLELLGKIHQQRWPVLMRLVEGVKPLDLAPRFNAAILIGKSRQILLWDEAHFALLRMLLVACNWSDELVAIYRPARLDPLLSHWAGLHHFNQLQEMRSGDGKKLFQIDKAIEHRTGRLSVTHDNRVAVVRSPHNKQVADNFELLTLWLAVTLGRHLS